MSNNLIQYAFVAGEVSSTFFGRTDLEKYDLGMEKAQNWFVDYRGGLTTRPGTEFCEYVKDADKNTRFFPFRFNDTVANSYVILFGDEYIRFLQEGSYVLETAKVITSVSAASPGVVTSAAHGYVDGDWIKILGRTFIVDTLTVNTFALKDPFGVDVNTVGDTALLTATEAFRIYTLTATNLTSARILTLNLHQHLDTIYITRRGLSPRKLVRTAHTSWALSPITFGVSVTGCPTLTLSTNADENGAILAAITAVDIDGNESLPTYTASMDLTIFDSSEDQINYNWAPSLAAVDHYNIYRSTLVPQLGFGGSPYIGYVGQSRGLAFTDQNITPDFTITPPRNQNPFAAGRIIDVRMTAVGAGYNINTTVTMTDATGSGFYGHAVVDYVGQITGVFIIDGGEDYTAPTAVFTGGGAGAAATVTIGPTSQTSPGLFTVFQQRGVYASSDNQPVTLWGSVPGVFNDFSYSDITTASDSYEFTLDVGELSHISHLVPSRGGLLVLTPMGIWLLTGGNELAVTPVNAIADAQIYKGVDASVTPILLDADVLYVESKGSGVRLLSYSDVTKVYGGQDMTILANHLFGATKKITAWGWAEKPASIVWAVRSDGALLSFTYVAEQKVVAWTPCSTQGYFKDVVSTQEGFNDEIYFMVERVRGDGTSTKFIEKLASRDITDVEEAWCLDCGLELDKGLNTTQCTVSGFTGTVTITADSGTPFTLAFQDRIFRGNGGKGIITYINNTTLSVDLINSITETAPEQPTVPAKLLASTWYTDSLATTVSGLYHLEGKEVMVLADGSVQGPFTVSGGAITLDVAASWVTVGLSYRCVARNLPLTARDAIMEDKRKRLVGLGIRIHDTRGLKTGIDLDHLYSMKERRTEPMGEPIRLQRDMRYELIDGNWDVNGQLYLVQDYPLPATVLGIVQDFEVGDDPA